MYQEVASNLLHEFYSPHSYQYLSRRNFEDLKIAPREKIGEGGQFTVFAFPDYPGVVLKHLRVSNIQRNDPLINIEKNWRELIEEHFSFVKALSPNHVPPTMFFEDTASNEFYMLQQRIEGLPLNSTGQPKPSQTAVEMFLLNYQNMVCNHRITPEDQYVYSVEKDSIYLLDTNFLFSLKSAVEGNLILQLLDVDARDISSTENLVDLISSTVPASSPIVEYIVNDSTIGQGGFIEFRKMMMGAIASFVSEEILSKLKSNSIPRIWKALAYFPPNGNSDNIFSRTLKATTNW